MNIFQVSKQNLLRKKVRTAFTVLGISLSAWVLVTLLGFNNGYEQSLNKDIENMGFQIVLTAKGCPYEAATLMLKGGAGLRYMPENIIDEVAGSPEVNKTTSMLMHAEFDPNKGDNGGVAIFLGVNPKTYPGMKPYFKFKQGGWFAKNNVKEVVFGYEAAELEQREVGDLFLIPTKDGEIEATVVGVLERTGTQDDGMIFMPIETAQNIFDKQNLITMLGIRLNKDVDARDFEEKLYKLPDVQVVSMAQVRNTIMNLVSSAKVIVMSIAFIAFLIAMFGVLNTILMSVFERYQEIGILKSMGAFPKDIFTMIWIETTLLCSAGGIAGIILSFAFSNLSEVIIRNFLPFAPNGSLINITKETVILSFLAITLTGVLGGIYPAWKASRFRPLDAIRSE